MEEKNFITHFIGNAAIVRILQRALIAPSAAYVLVGQAHLGKKTLAETFVCALLQLDSKESWQNHPDVFVLEAEEGKKQISVEQVRDLRERLSMRPLRAPRMVTYVPAADSLNESGTNALLKVVEEPPAHAVFVLVAEDAGRLPATLKSRCVILPMNIVPRADLVRGLIDRGISEQLANTSADHARGRPGIAIASPEQGELGAGAAQLFLSVPLGKRLQLIEDLTKVCEAEASPQQAWRETIHTLMAETSRLVEKDSRAILFGLGLVIALRSVGSSVSPRIFLEALAIRLDGKVNVEIERLLPKHISRGLSELFID